MPPSIKEGGKERGNREKKKAGSRAEVDWGPLLFFSFTSPPAPFSPLYAPAMQGAPTQGASLGAFPKLQLCYSYMLCYIALLFPEMLLILHVDSIP